jgi:uncharacterized protein YebE (UPF0316 family)
MLKKELHFIFKKKYWKKLIKNIAKHNPKKYTIFRELEMLNGMFLLKGLGPLWTNFPPW